MDRLPLLKALADDSRYAIFVEINQSSRELSTTEIAERLDLHPNTVRLHLERLREVGLVEHSTRSHGAIGRPQHHWTVAPGAPGLGLEPSGWRLLAHLLAEVAASGVSDSDSLIGIGRAVGTDRASGPSRSPRTPAAEAGDGPPSPPAHAGAGEAALGSEHPPAARPPAVPSGRDRGVRRVVDELSDLGFDPVVDGHDVAFTSCPFRELATAYPDLVCTLHRGVTEGLAGSAGVQIEHFSTLVDPDPCRVELRSA